MILCFEMMHTLYISNSLVDDLCMLSYWVYNLKILKLYFLSKIQENNPSRKSYFNFLQVSA